MSALSLAALAVAHGELAKHVRGGLCPYGRFRSPEIDGYMRLVGLTPHADTGLEGWAWCAAAIHACFDKAARDAAEAAAPPNGTFTWNNPCPRTAGAIHLWDTSPVRARTQLPAPGDVFVVAHEKGRGHCGIVASVSPDGHTIRSVEGDTNAAGSSTGDSWGEHLWSPRDGVRGRLLGFLSLGD